jgi:hypothetical protein
VNATQNEIVAALRGDYASGMNKLFRHFAEKVSFLAGTSWAFICALAALLSWGASGRSGRAARASRKALQLDSMSGFEALFLSFGWPRIIGNPNRIFASLAFRRQ